jgi:hypothetical protein
LPPPELLNSIQPWLPVGATFAAQRLRGGDRWFALVIGKDGMTHAALKVGISDQAQESLRNETRNIREVSQLLDPPLAVPLIEEHHEGVIVMEPIAWKMRPDRFELPPVPASVLGRLLAKTSHVEDQMPRGRTRGDFAPWNILWDGNRWVLINWEQSQSDGLPFFDIFHHVVQSHALFDYPSAKAIIDGFLLDNQLARSLQLFASAAGVDPNLAAALFPRYLTESPQNLDERAPGYEKGLSARKNLEFLWHEHVSRVVD